MIPICTPWASLNLVWKMTVLENMYQEGFQSFNFWAQSCKVWSTYYGEICQENRLDLYGLSRIYLWIWIRNRCLSHLILKSQQVKLPFFLRSLATPLRKQKHDLNQRQDTSVSHQMRKWSNLQFMAPKSILLLPKLTTIALNGCKSQLSTMV